jgi:hypothetical protein
VLAAFTGFVIWYCLQIRNSCVGWEKGIGGVTIDNDNGECIIPTPNYCEMSIRNGFLDMAGRNEDCNKKKMTVDTTPWPDYLKSRNATRIGYPRPENWSNEIKIHETLYKEAVYKNIVDMDDPSVPSEIKDNIEITVDMTDEDSHLININVKRNETRVGELKKIREEVLKKDIENGNTERLDHNVLVLYIDNISRAHFHRKMTEFNKWLDQFAEQENAELVAIEFMRYHTISKNTYKSNNG